MITTSLANMSAAARAAVLAMWRVNTSSSRASSTWPLAADSSRFTLRSFQSNVAPFPCFLPPFPVRAIQPSLVDDLIHPVRHQVPDAPALHQPPPDARRRDVDSSALDGYDLVEVL